MKHKYFERLVRRIELLNKHEHEKMNFSEEKMDLLASLRDYIHELRDEMDRIPGDGKKVV